MPQRVRIGIYLGTVTFPKRSLMDEETAVDYIELDIGDHERVLEAELHEQPAYKPSFLRDGSEGQTRDKSVVNYRYRVVTLAEIPFTEGADASMQLEAGAVPIEDADVVPEIEP